MPSRGAGADLRVPFCARGRCLLPPPPPPLLLLPPPPPLLLLLLLLLLPLLLLRQRRVVGGEGDGREALLRLKRPRWMPDEEALRCASVRCRRKFSALSVRKHHCRACGRVGTRKKHEKKKKDKPCTRCRRRLVV